ncbi:hypothetical protein BUALT_Bualt03G0142600 [Buddleja alternifolia]|uniref:Glutamate receptor n=1 Tax=Buddleja alternifolia TaxID=168488 RepID=A0AAV6Y4I1_9LAMI|nr:hypothetical protein BUALT_Bualt03G0142600 [Buddleja alternifolia]
MNAYFYLLLYFVAFANLLSPLIISTSAIQFTDNSVVGAILDCSSRVGKEERVAMEIAIQDLYESSRKNRKLNLRVKCSRGEPIQAAQAARHLMNKNHVQAILGPNSWEESSAVAEVAKQFDVPILSFSDSTPPWATTHWPFFIQASPTTTNQMKALADIIQSWQWRRVTVIYEDTNSAANNILNHLSGALKDVDVQMSRLVPLPSFATCKMLHEELEELKKENCRVFVVHAGLALATRVFEKAKEMEMMESGYVWIATDPTTSLVHSLNASVISSMQGVLGVRRYFPDTGRNFLDFYSKFERMFRGKYPEEKNHEPGISALQAYDATLAVGLAINASVKSGRKILENIEEIDFDGLNGKIQFKERKLTPTNQFQIINVIGKSSYRELGFWSVGLGFSTVNESKGVYNSSMDSLGPVIWPGGPWTTPRGWDIPTISNPLIIGVPNVSITNKFVKVEFDPSTNNYNFSGFSIQVFEKAVQNLKYPLPYKFIPFNGSYSDLVEQVRLKEFDAAVGDIAITSLRYDYVEFTHAHTESGVVMVVLIQSQSNRTWLFMKPFTNAMWLLTVFINVYNGFVIWSIEKNYCSELKGPFLNQIGTLLWLAFATLFSFHANLASMLTVRLIEPKIANIETLKSENAFIGYSKMSFVRGYLEEALHFNPNQIKNYTTPEAYAKALKSGEISAAFLEVPVAKLFVAKYCKSFTIAGPSYKVGGYGFAFPKGSVLVPEIDKALLNVFEMGTLKDLEKSLIGSEKCVDKQTDNETTRLSPQSFFVLFIFTGGTSTAALAIYFFRDRRKVYDSMAEHKGIWLLILMVLSKQRNMRNRFSRKVRDVPRDSDPNS